MIEIRTLQESDIPGIVRLVERAGFPARSTEGWRWAIFSNPEQGDIPPGLCAVKNGELISMIGLQARTFMIDGKPVKGASGHTFISSPEGRGAGFRVARRALAVPGIAMTYTLNNNALAGRFHKKIGLGAWLGQAGRERLEWPLRPLKMAAGLVPSRVARNEKAYDWLSAREWFKARRFDLAMYSGPSGDVRNLHPNAAEDAVMIDEFGLAVANAEAAAPLRNAETYTYQMTDPDAPGRTALLGSISNGVIQGLAQIVLTKPNAFEPVETVFSDLVLHPAADRPVVLANLISAARSVSRKAGAARLRLPLSCRFSQDDLANAPRALHRVCSYDTAHAHFTENANELERRWRPTGYESDFFFALRIPPATAQAGQRSRKAAQI